MAGKTERIVIEIVPGENGTNQVGVEYFAATTEASLVDEQAARELAMHTLCCQAIELRIRQGQSVPPAMLVLKEAKTFKDFY